MDEFGIPHPHGAHAWLRVRGYVSTALRDAITGNRGRATEARR
jgi:hypothetical protein